MKRVTYKTAYLVKDTIVTLLKPLQLFVKTNTSDNGKEFAMHQDIKRMLKAQFYFADTYASWQRGTNENTNGLIRQYLPKGEDFAKITNEYIQTIEDALNNRPRKRLGYKTPNQVFYGIG